MPNLLTPLSFAGLTLRNRIVMPPMWSGQATPEGFVTDAIVDYHRRRAAAGCGLVIVEHSFVHPLGRHSANQIGAHTGAAVHGLSRLASAIKAEGAAACLQLSYAGSRSSSAVLGVLPLAPSAVKHPYEPEGEVPQEATPGQLAGIAAAFGDAADRARLAGFDAVEIHAAHGFLLSQFLSPLTNRRTDDYGGAVEQRARLHREVVAAVRARVGAWFPVFIRLGAHDETPGGLELDEACNVAACMAENSLNLIDVSGGLQGSRGVGKGPAYFVRYAEAIKRRVGVPVLVTGGIAEPAMADQIIRDEQADLVGVGRAMLNDPGWAQQAIRRLSQVPQA
ncbi:MAG: NADH:flavin oxidoreductase [Acidobacteria bacterium]|nr:MAG: NADH:flavin oxidoreductase [Acidobacteriota bacterium]